MSTPVDNSESHPPPAHPARRVVRREIAAAVTAAWLPVALTANGFGPSTTSAFVGSALCSSVLGLLGFAPPRARLAVAIGAGTAAGLMFGTATGTALAAGLVLGDWVARRRPVSTRLGPPRGAAVPVVALLLVAAERSNPSWGAYGPGPRIIVLLLCIGLVAQLARVSGTSIAWPVFLAAASVPLAYRGFDFDPATAIVLPLLTALAVAVLLASQDMPRAWRDRLHGVVPYLLVLPSAAWWMWNVSSWWAGTILIDEVGFAAWDAYTSTLPRDVLVVKATFALPAWMAAVLGIGGAAVLHGRRVLVVAALTIVALTAWAIMLASAWMGGAHSAMLP